MKNYKGILFAILASVAFGLMPIFAKFAYQNGSNSTTVLFFRFSIASVLLFIYLIGTKQSIKVTKKQFLYLFFTGLIGYTVTTQTLFMSYNYLGVGLATTLHFVYPAFVCIFEYVLFKKLIGRNKMISLALAGIGVFALVAFENNVISTIGVALAIISGITYGMNVIMLAVDTVKNLNHKVTTMYIAFGAGIGMLIYGVFDNSLILKLNFNLVFSYSLIAIVSTIVSIILLLKAIEIIGATSTSILGTFEPIVSIVMGIIVFNESLTFALVLGTIFIIISTIILAKDKSGNETIEEVIENNI